MGWVRVDPPRFVALLIWWFAIVSASGEVSYLEYRTERACKTIQAAYVRAHANVTTCQWKGEHELTRPSS